MRESGVNSRSETGGAIKPISTAALSDRELFQSPKLSVEKPYRTVEPIWLWWLPSIGPYLRCKVVPSIGQRPHCGDLIRTQIRRRLRCSPKA
jgi:hypothetical protein